METERLRGHSVERDAASSAASIVRETITSPGQPLDEATRAFMEPRFGHDFSQVRIHADAKAAESAQRVNALAYTVGRAVVFGAGQYSPVTESGRRMLAHELAHVIQQESGSVSENRGPSYFEVSNPSGRFEREAETTADRVVKLGLGESGPDLGTHLGSASGFHSEGNDVPLSQNLGHGGLPLMRQAVPSEESAGGKDQCAGWKTDPQSFSIQLARHYYRTQFKKSPPSPNSVRPGLSPDQWIVKFNGEEVTVDMANVRNNRASATSAGELCHYTFTCSYSGSITFSKLQCPSEVF